MTRELAICVTYDKWCQSFLWHQLALASCEFCLNDLLDGNVCKKYLLFPYFFLVCKHDFIRCVDFTRIAASNTTSGDVTNKFTHRIFNTDIRLILVYILCLVTGLRKKFCPKPFPSPPLPPFLPFIPSFRPANGFWCFSSWKFCI